LQNERRIFALLKTLTFKQQLCHWRRGSSQGGGIAPFLNFGLLENLVGKFSSKMPNLGLKNPHFGKKENLAVKLKY